MIGMDRDKKVPYNSMPSLIRGSFLTKEQAEKLKEPFKDVVSVTRCKECKHRGDSLNCPVALIADLLKGTRIFTYEVTDEWFCADGKRRDGDG